MTPVEIGLTPEQLIAVPFADHKVGYETQLSVRFDASFSGVDKLLHNVHQFPKVKKAEPMQNSTMEVNQYAHRLYVLTLAIKGLLGLFQVLIAVALISGAADQAPAFANWLFSAELAENPKDFFATKIISFVGVFPQTDLTFYKVYFSVHGLLHVGIVAALLFGARWAYHVGVTVLAAFVVYQTIEWFHVHSMMLVVLTAIDLFVIYLTVREHRS